MNKLDGRIKNVTETVNILAFRNRKKVISIVVNSIINISETIPRLFVITQIITETVQVAESIIKDLRDGLVRVRRSIRINKRGGSASLKGRSKTTRLSRKGSQEVHDRSKNAKVNKRSQNIKGEDT
jgi:hypothetical protein